MTKIKAKINNIAVEVEENTSILEAARTLQINIPTLCKHKDLEPSAACGICIVKVKNSKKMLRACCTNIEAGMEILTHDPEIVEVRRTVVELALSNHPSDCLSCGRNNNCELQKLAADFGIRQEVLAKSYNRELPVDSSTGTIILEPQKCIRCGRCVYVCQNMQNVWALNFLGRGINMRIAPAGDIQLGDSPCVRCGQCSAHCPTGAIFEYDEVEKVWSALQDEERFCVVQIAPAVRVAIGEAFGFAPGTNLTKKLYAILRRLGFKAVFDTNFGADVTIMEEAAEFVERFANKKGQLPLITTCCPSWVDFMEKFWPDTIKYFSSCKSPHQMVGVLTKTYYAQKMKLDPKKMTVVSIMPCTSKKYEIQRTEEMQASGQQDIDISLTTRELVRMINQAGIDFKNLPDEEPDLLLADYSGAGTIFGATGGVMEAALRTAFYNITGNNLPKIEIEQVRGLKGIKEGEIEINGQKIRIAVAHGLSNVEHVLKKIKAAQDSGAEPPYHFVEVMACPGGCVGGGGQPYGVDDQLRQQRARGLYQEDQGQKLRCSHENPFVQKLYADFLDHPLSHKSHQLLHTHYKSRPVYLK